MSQYSKFIRPGYYRVDATANPQTDIYVSAYKGNGKTVIVAINQSDSQVVQPFTIQNGTVTSVTPYRTSASDNLITLPAITLTGGVFSSPLPPQSVTTFVSN
jgi:glucuronoarabinoxylan endo-1,4-beta-xylanase